MYYNTLLTDDGIINSHDDVIKWKHLPRYWPFVRGIHRSPVHSPHKGQWRGALMFSLICVLINDWVNSREAGDLRRHRAHYDVILMVEKNFGWALDFWDLCTNSCQGDVRFGSRTSNCCLQISHQGPSNNRFNVNQGMNKEIARIVIYIITYPCYKFNVHVTKPRWIRGWMSTYIPPLTWVYLLI